MSEPYGRQLDITKNLNNAISEPFHLLNTTLKTSTGHKATTKCLHTLQEISYFKWSAGKPFLNKKMS